MLLLHRIIMSYPLLLGVCNDLLIVNIWLCIHCDWYAINVLLTWWVSRRYTLYISVNSTLEVGSFPRVYALFWYIREYVNDESIVLTRDFHQRTIWNLDLTLKGYNGLVPNYGISLWLCVCVCACMRTNMGTFDFKACCWTIRPHITISCYFRCWLMSSLLIVDDEMYELCVWTVCMDLYVWKGAHGLKWTKRYVWKHMYGYIYICTNVKSHDVEPCVDHLERYDVVSICICMYMYYDAMSRLNLYYVLKPTNSPT